jgi:hypothetical protein
MLRYLIFGVIVTAALVGAKLWIDATGVMSTKTETATHTPVSTPTNTQQDARPGAANTPPFIKNAAPNQNPDETTLADNSLTDSAISDLAWSDGDPTLTPPEQYQRKGIEARALHLNLEKISELRAGDDITVLIPQTGQNYTMGIDSISTHQNGSRRVTGSVQNATSPYNIVLTEGKTSTFATINTPDGAYMLEAIGNSGWITSLADLDYLSAPNQTDARIPNIAPATP